MDKTEFLETFNLISALLTQRMNEDPKAAISAARAILVTPDLLDETHRKIIASGVLTDAGNDCQDAEAVDEAVGLLEQLADLLPDEPSILYNLGNALIPRANLIVLPTAADWCVVTGDDRSRAKVLFQKVAEHRESDNSLRARALNNLGNSLARTFRLIEAYDCYARAVEQDPRNSIALSCAAKSLIDLVDYGLVVPGDVEPAIAGHVSRANASADTINDLAGDAAGAKIHAFLSGSSHSGTIPDLSNATGYQQFVANHRLALVPTIEGLDLQLSRWDSLRLPTIVEEVHRSGIPPIFAMFNGLKSDFLAARYAAYLGLQQQCPESGKYHDTLDFALYGTSISMLGIAQKSCFDLLDKSAVAISSYLGLAVKSSDTYFSNLCFEKPKKGQLTGAPRELKQEVVIHIGNGDFPLLALAEVARDLSGYLKSKKAIRHAATHRFTVLHDIGCTPSRASDSVEHYAVEDFKRHLIESLQMSRAVLFYFVHLVLVHERRCNPDRRFIGVVKVPDHDYIRGEADFT
jgi:tetratricopeptide (TPR) repeat protein